MKLQKGGNSHTQTFRAAERARCKVFQGGVDLMTKEQKFYKTLQNVLIGFKIEGKGEFINLMRIKSKY